MLNQVIHEQKVKEQNNGNGQIANAGQPKNVDEWVALIHKVGPIFAQRELDHDRDDSFVEQNYQELMDHGLLSAAIPVELGGGGLSHAEMATVLKTLAHYSSSTALANSMHQHLVAANVWKYKGGKGGEKLLQKVVNEGPILISTGARDWLESNGSMEKVEGGYLVSAYKSFASQSAIGDIAVTSAPYYDPEEGDQVLHFPIPLSADGVTVIENWQAMGMRGTGSHTIRFDKVFVPESAIALKRPLGEFHPVWNVVLAVAMPLIMSVYVGIAQKAAKMAVDHVKQRESRKPYVASSVGAMNNTLVTAEVLLEDMIRLTNNFEFAPTDQLGSRDFEP